MQKQKQLNLLIIDDNQLYAEHLVGLLEKHYYRQVNLGFLDAKDELIKLLRQSWDIILMGNAYDLSFKDVKEILKAHDAQIPVIALLPDDATAYPGALTANEQAQTQLVSDPDKTHKLLPLYTYWGAADALRKNKLLRMAIRICREHEHHKLVRELERLKMVLSDAEQRANILIKNSKSAVAYIEDGLHIYANEPYLEMFGFKTLDELMGIPVVDLIARNNIQDFKTFLKDFEKGNRKNVEFKFESVRKDNTTFAAKLQLAAATYDGQPCLQVIIQPNEQANSAELAKKLEAMERIDSITGLFNRHGFERLFNRLRDVIVEKNLSVGLMALRIDNIGKIHASVGIEGIDGVMVAVANILEQHLTEIIGVERVKNGYLSRFNDSMFMIIIPNMRQQDLTALGQKLVADINSTIIEIGHRTVKTTVTIGATLVNASAPDTNSLINRVIQAVGMAAKVNKDSNDDKDLFYLYDPSSFASSDDGALYESLRDALEHSKFNLLYQPIYDVENDVSNMFEVFLRLPLADGSLMAPDKFLEVATRHQLMDKIDRWVLIQACKDLKRYRHEVDASARLLVHLSQISLADATLPSFMSRLMQALGTSEPGVLTVQFNETMVMDHLAVAAKQSNELNQMGCHLGIYNFGSAVNAMEVLEFVKPQLVRLDRSYIKDLSNNDNVNTVATVVREITERGSSCLMPFIEDPAAMSAAWTVGARYLQGAYLQKASDTMHIENETS